MIAGRAWSGAAWEPLGGTFVFVFVFVFVQSVFSQLGADLMHLPHATPFSSNEIQTLNPVIRALLIMQEAISVDYDMKSVFGF